MKHLFTLTLLITLLAACKKDRYSLYNNGALLQFGPTQDRFYSATEEMKDTMKPFTFYYHPATITQDTVFFDIYAIGGVSSKDRPFTLEQVNLPGAGNAVPGVHYKPFSDPSLREVYVIKAGAVHALVPIVLLRDASLKTQNIKLQLQIKANDQFLLGETRKLWRRVELTDMLSRPAAWNASAAQSYWGDYSTVKHAFMIAQTGEKWDQDFMTTIGQETASLTFWRLKLKTLLVDYNNTHPGTPLIDENGNFVVFP
ncbi:DUF4843 domain-containing protein [Chitinophaga flava]|uniref:DUF4843 domain-containing protein n=1 Tax=Chitinophaga flava TaxID=2259036 RepID=A0A365XRK4_9BACT|nr:DUF4843 domain-containing protein [Chitinophaga flava]RBL88989.1 hypothetical protein DF182_20830 [Chitinophaga flava]